MESAQAAAQAKVSVQRIQTKEVVLDGGTAASITSKRIERDVVVKLPMGLLQSNKEQEQTFLKQLLKDLTDKLDHESQLSHIDREITIAGHGAVIKGDLSHTSTGERLCLEITPDDELKTKLLAVTEQQTVLIEDVASLKGELRLEIKRIDRRFAVLETEMGKKAASRFQHGSNSNTFQRPPLNDQFIPRKALIEKMHAHFAKGGQQHLTLTACGLGGVGKTQLASHYFLQPPEDKKYSLKAWFYADTQEHLALQYINLGQANGMRFDDKQPLMDKAQRVKAWLEQQENALLVYDNVPQSDIIDELLPEAGHHHILITSRHESDWTHTLPIDVMTEEEALALLQITLGLNDVKIMALSESDLTDMKTLLKTLGYLPLAIVQAGVYMKKGKLSSQAYLSLYQTHQTRLLSDDQHLKKINLLFDTKAKRVKQTPVWITFDMNLATLKKDNPLALSALESASFLASSGIPDILLNVIQACDAQRPRFSMVEGGRARGAREGEERKEVAESTSTSPAPDFVPEDAGSSSATSALDWTEIKASWSEYSLMQVEEQTAQWSMHPLLQDIIRTQLSLSDQVGVVEYVGTIISKLYLYYQAKGVTDYIALLSHAERLHAHAKMVSTQAKQFRTETTSPSYPALLATQPAELGCLYYDMGLYQSSQATWTDQLLIKQVHYGPDHVDVAITLGNLGAVYGALGDHEKERSYLERALLILEKYYGADHVEVAKTLGNLGTAYGDLGDQEKARAYLERALSIFERYYGADHVEVVITLVNLGNVYGALGDQETRRAYLARALSIEERHYGADHVGVAKTLGNLGGAYGALGDREKQQSYLERALSIFERYYGADHVEVAITLNNLGVAYGALGDHEKARAYLERALSIKEQYYGVDHVEVAKTLTNLGTAYGTLGDQEKQRSYLERALSIFERYYGADHVEVAITLNNLGVAYGALGDREKARAYLERALSIEERYYGADHVEVAITLHNLSTCYAQLGDLLRAKNVSERAYTIFRGYYGEGHPHTQAAHQAFQLLSNMPAMPGMSSTPSRSPFQLAQRAGSKAFNAKDYVKAYQAWQSALNLLNQDAFSQEEEKRLQARLDNNLGVCCREQGQYSKAIEHFDQALEIHEQLSGVESEQYKKIKTKKTRCEVKQQAEHDKQQAITHYQAGHWDEALQLFKKALDGNQQFFGDTLHVDLASVHWSLSSCYLKLNDTEQAKHHVQASYGIRQELLGENHQLTQKAKTRLDECNTLHATEVPELQGTEASAMGQVGLLAQKEKSEEAACSDPSSEENASKKSTKRSSCL